MFLDRGLGMFYIIRKVLTRSSRITTESSGSSTRIAAGLISPEFDSALEEEYCFMGEDEGGSGGLSISVEGGAIDAGLLLDLRILRNVWICWCLAKGGMQVDWMMLIRRTRPKGEGMAVA